MCYRAHAGKVTPDLFFPMRVGLMWAERVREDEEYQRWMRSGEEPNGFYEGPG